MRQATVSSIRPPSILVVLLLVIGLAACGGGGGPKDLNLTASPPVTVTTPPPSTTAAPTTTAFLPGYASLVARARVAHLAVYPAPDVRRSKRTFAEPQVFPVEVRRSDGWVKVRLPLRPSGRIGWVRAADVTITQVDYRIRVMLAARRITVFGSGRVIYRGPVVVGTLARSIPPGHYYLRRLLTEPRSRIGSPYTFALINRLAQLVPLGTPVDVVA